MPQQADTQSEQKDVRNSPSLLEGYVTSPTTLDHSQTLQWLPAAVTRKGQNPPPPSPHTYSYIPITGLRHSSLESNYQAGYIPI